MTIRLLVLSVCFLATAGMALRAMQPELVALREPLAKLPTTIGPWTGWDHPKLADEILAVLGADEYINRTYGSGETPPVALYIGYYRSQREGDTIHSPLNCLPGAGWQPVSAGRRSIDVPHRREPVVVNRYLIQKGLDRQVVLYWYQSHGRVIASEYWSKIYLVYDAVRLNRSDAALVRVTSPVPPTETSDAAAEKRAIEFVRTLFAHLDRHLPS